MEFKEISVPELALVFLIGASGSGKSTFAKTHFAKLEYVSSGFCRGVVSNDENSLAASKDAFELLGFIVAQRLKKGLLTVIDATNVQHESRKSLLNIAREYGLRLWREINSVTLPRRRVGFRESERNVLGTNTSTWGGRENWT